MGNIITTILTINGTEEQISKVRDYIGLSNNETHNYRLFVPEPEGLSDNLVDYPGCPFQIPEWKAWEWDNMGILWDVNHLSDELVDAPNRIMFSTKSDPPYEELITLSAKFPEASFNFIFSDSPSFLYAGEYDLKAGEIISSRWYHCLCESRSTITEDEAMEYYFRTNEYDRENWRKNEEGEWVNLEDEEEEE